MPQYVCYFFAPNQLRFLIKFYNKILFVKDGQRDKLKRKCMVRKINHLIPNNATISSTV